MKTYGFCAKPALSPFQNAVAIRGETNAAIYFSQPANLAFHDLTPNKQLPKIAQTVLGLNLKFIPTPSTTTYDLTGNFARFERDFNLKVFFGMEETSADDIRIEKEHLPKLYIKSDWVVPDHYISNEIHSRQRAFQKALEPHFTKRPGKPNLLPYQQRILRTIQRDDNIIIINANKGLGPCAVT